MPNLLDHISTLPSLLGFGFGSAGMLWFLTAATAPILIHLWNKRKHREMRWAAMEYLLAAIRKNSRRIQVEQLILLAVRVLLILLLAVAVAEPFLEQIGLSRVAGRRTHKVLVIDGSFSMAYKPTAESRFDRAKELATQIVEESSLGDGFTLVLMGSPPRVVVGTPVFEHASFVEEIKALELPHGGGDLPAALAKIEEILTETRRDFPKLAQEEVYFLTDLGRNSWAPRFGSSSDREAFLKRSKRLAQRAALGVIDLGQPGSDNAAVTDIHLEQSFATLDRNVLIEAQLRSFARQSQAQQLVELLIDGRRAGEQYVDLEAGDEAAVSFNYRFDSPGEHTIEVRLAADELDLDNHRWLSLPVKERLRVLCIDGQPSGAPFGGATDYLAVALEDMAQMDVAGEAALQERDLATYDAVFVCNVGQFNRGEARQLRRYLDQGGGLIFFLGDQVQPQSYNQRLTGEEGETLRVLPARLGSVVRLDPSSPQYLLDPLEYRHPILQVFRDNEQTGLLSTPIYQYFQLEIPEDSRSRTAIAFTGGDPLIVSEEIGRGRSIVVATSASTGPSNDLWTVMQMRPNFLPLVQEILAAALAGQIDQRSLLVGQPLLGERLSAAGNDEPLKVRTPGGREQQVRVDRQEDSRQWTFADTDSSGIYTVQYPAPRATTRQYAVNLDTQESDLTKLQVDELREEVWQGVPFTHRTNWQDLEEPAAGEIVSRDYLSWWLLWCVMGLLLTETLLAWWFGRHST